ncbi:MAG: P-loop NTPase fold protein [Myxococcales bacterium]
MSRYRDSAYLRQVAEKVLRDPTPADGLLPLPDHRIEDAIAEVTAAEEAIWGSVEHEYQYLHDLEAREREIWDRLVHANRSPTAALAITRRLVWFAAFPTIVGGLVWFVRDGVRSGWRVSMGEVVKGASDQLFVVPALVCVGLTALYLLLGRHQQFERARRESAMRVLAGPVEELTRQARRHAETALRGSVVRAGNRFSASRAAAVFQTSLQVGKTAGLDAAFDPRFDVTTTARDRLRFLLSRMGGGSIGIAGPRGAGKSALIASICQDSLTHLDGQPTLTVTTSAPVEYQPREFLLHLFATLCHRILERANPNHERLDWRRRKSELEERVAPRTTRALMRVGTMAVYLGIVMATGAYWLARSNVNDAFAARAEAEREREARTEVERVGGQANVKPALAEDPRSARSEAVKIPTLSQELGLTPSVLAKGSASFLALGALLLLFVSVRRDLPRVFGGGADERSRAPWDDLEEEGLQRQAAAWLTEIKFQQSYTSGWSGAMKFPIGLEGSLNRARALAQQQLTLPEIVDGFVRLLRRAATEYRVVIGIDELDKLEQDEKAQRFLNEIKAVFGPPRVFYLISVSENAMSNFERRGLPFRDAFDSAFDEVIAVGYMDFQTARRVLNERVPGIPVQFQRLLFCFSGGLPRELIRVCRDLVEQATLYPQRTDLESMTLAMVRLDLETKLKALMVAVEREDAERHAGALMGALHRLEASPKIDRDTLETVSQIMLATERAISGGPLEVPSMLALQEKLDRLYVLQQELGSYLWFLASLLAEFPNTLDEAALSAREPGHELLVSVRRSLAGNTNLAKSQLEELQATSPARGARLLKVPAPNRTPDIRRSAVPGLRHVGARSSGMYPRSPGGRSSKLLVRRPRRASTYGR